MFTNESLKDGIYMYTIQSTYKNSLSSSTVELDFYLTIVLLALLGDIGEIFANYEHTHGREE